MPQIAKKIEKCRVCGNAELIPCIDIGEQYLSSVFPDDLDYRDTAPKYPLDMVMCKKEGERTCGLVQLGHELDLTAMYDAYPYTSATNSSMTKILEDVANSGKSFDHLTEEDVVLDIGGNDGTLLSFYKGKQLRLINIDPAKNVEPAGTFEDGEYVFVSDFFNKAAYDSVSDKPAKLIFSIAMYYHLNDPMTFSREVSQCLADDGVWIVQMAYLPAMLRTNMYDNIVHEHAGYYGAQQMKWVMDQLGLEVFDVEENDVYGGSFRIFVKKQGNNKYPLTDRYKELLKKELEEDKIFNLETYEAFMRRIEKTRDDLRAFCEEAKDNNKTIWIYGASTKGNTILQFCDLGKEYFVAAADANPFKVGKYIIGADIPIKDEVEMRKVKPDYLLALPYSFVKGFMERESELLEEGTRFVVPLPEVEILEN